MISQITSVWGGTCTTSVYQFTNEGEALPHRGRRTNHDNDGV